MFFASWAVSDSILDAAFDDVTTIGTPTQVPVGVNCPELRGSLPSHLTQGGATIMGARVHFRIVHAWVQGLGFRATPPGPAKGRLPPRGLGFRACGPAALLPCLQRLGPRQVLGKLPIALCAGGGVKCEVWGEGAPRQVLGKLPISLPCNNKGGQMGEGPGGNVGRSSSG